MQQGAAWGEAVVGIPLKLRPTGFEYPPGAAESATRAADEAYEKAKAARDARDASADADAEAGGGAAGDGAEGEGARGPVDGAAVDYAAAGDGVAAAAANENEDGSSRIVHPMDAKDAKDAMDAKDAKDAKGAKDAKDAPAAEENAVAREDSQGLGSPAASDASAGLDPEPEWVTASVVEYNEQTGEHRLLFADGAREWLALCAQETRPARGAAS